LIGGNGEMKRKIVLVGLALALILTCVMPAAGVAAKGNQPATGVVATGFITQIDPTTTENVVPLGTPQWGWKVTGRSVNGIFAGPQINDSFTFTYNAIVDLTQAGTLWGTLKTADYTLNVLGKSGSAYFVGMYGEYPLFGVDITGKWSAARGAVGGGDFTGSLVFIPSPDGAHIAAIIPDYSPITLTGVFVDKTGGWNWWWHWFFKRN
jgi:hypothetical protein